MAAEIGKIPPTDIPDQILARSEVLGDHVFDRVEDLGQTNEYETGCLLITAPDKVGKEKDELRASNFWLSVT